MAGKDSLSEAKTILSHSLRLRAVLSAKDDHLIKFAQKFSISNSLYSNCDNNLHITYFEDCIH